MSRSIACLTPHAQQLIRSKRSEGCNLKSLVYILVQPEKDKNNQYLVKVKTNLTLSISLR